MNNLTDEIRADAPRPTITARAEAILTARHHKDQMEGDGAVGCFDAAAAVAELHAAGLLAPDPQIIRTREELANLDPDTLLAAQGLVAALPLQIMWHLDSPPESVLSHDDLLPAVVIATGDQARAARQALEDA